MLFLFARRIKSLVAVPVMLVTALLLSACASEQAKNAPGGIYDPHEEVNRANHEMNKAIDRVLVDPLSQGWGNATNGGVREVVSNFSSHLSLPNDIFNNVFQGNLDDALQNTGRFAFNTVVGFAGLFDPASDLGWDRVDTDFGETLHVWGAAEGPYVELPFFGPSTSRDTVGFAVDLVLDPFFVVVRGPEVYIGAVAYVFEAMGNRYEFDATVDSVLHESADSYAQARSIYLQNRRYQLGITAEDLYLDSGLDPYSDPYEDF